MRATLAALVFTVPAFAAFPPPAPADPAAVDDEGFAALFDRDHTEGWVQAGPGEFTVKDGVAASKGGMGLWYYEKKKFKNFILKLEFRQNRVDANSGVFVRFPRVDGDPWLPVKEGHEIQIAGDKPDTHTTGSIYDFQAATSIPLRPAGEWNAYEITCIGPRYAVRLNDVLINRYTSDRSLEGMIGLQNHDDNSLVRFRDVRIKELPDAAVDCHVLFDGTEPKGWKMAGPGSFEFHEGMLTAHGGMGLYWHERVCGDFILMLDWKVARKEDNSGVFVRFPDPGNDPWVAVNKGYEIQICDPAPPKHRTGDVYSFQESTKVPTKTPGEWNHYEIRAVGRHYTVWINGEQVNDYAGGEDRGLEGHVGVQNHGDDRVSFRNIRVVALKAQK